MTARDHQPVFDCWCGGTHGPIILVIAPVVMFERTVTLCE
jgi:hypothetical protein